MATPTSRRGQRTLIALAAAAALAASGCTSAPVKLSGRPTGEMSVPLTGVYKATFYAPLIGPISTRFTAQPTDGGFIANTRPGVAWDMIGGFQGFLGQIFVPYLFPGGVILTWTSHNPAPGSPGEGWLGIGGIKSAGVKTSMSAPGEPITLLSPDGRQVATMTIEPARGDGGPLADYPGLAEGAEQAIASHLYDRALAQSGQVRGYLSQLKDSSRIAQDDVEFIFGAILAGRSNIKFSLPLIFRRGRLDTHFQTEAHPASTPTLRASFDDESGIATLKVDAFLDAADVDHVFQQIVDWNPKGLILDLNTAPGITLASLRAASWLIDHPADAGFYFGQASREAGLAGRCDAFPRVEIDSAQAISSLESTLDSEGAASIIVKPAPHAYLGPVAILTTKRTSTSSEPLVWMLKNSGRARAFGERTAGRPLLSRPVGIGADWVIWLAACDYRPPAGDRITGRGIAPDVDCSKEAAKRLAAEWLEDQAKDKHAQSEPRANPPAPAATE